MAEQLIPNLPDDVALHCLSRSHYSTHHLATSVCRSWRHLFRSPEFHRLRRQSGQTRLAACLVQAIPSPNPDLPKPSHSAPPAFGISVFDSSTLSWERLHSYPNYPDRLPLFCHITSSQGKLITMGGWDPETYDPVTDVYIYDFRTREWARGRDMPKKQSLFAIGSVGGRVFIAGGHDESKNALDTAWEYEIEADKWTMLTRMSEARDECFGVMIGAEFWVVSGYETDAQGGFKRSGDVYDTVAGEWRKEEGVWDTCGGGSPRGCVGVKRDGGIFSWAGEAPARVSTCAVELGELVLVTGAERHGAASGFYMAERRGGEYGEMRKLEVPEEFSGFVQSACCVEI